MKYPIQSYSWEVLSPLTAIKDVLGHTDIRTTMKYAHTDIESQKVVFQKKTEIIALNQGFTQAISIEGKS